VRRWTALIAAAALSCLSKPALVPQLFTIDATASERGPTGSARGASPTPGGPTVAVRRVSVAAPFDGRELVYRTGAHRLERDPYAILAASPASLLTDAIRGHLGRAGYGFEAAEASGAHPELLMDVYVRELSGDFVHPEEPAGVIAAAFEISEPGVSSPLLRKEYTRRIVLPHRTADAVVTAWNQGLAEMLGELDRDLDAALLAAARLHH